MKRVFGAAARVHFGRAAVAFAAVVLFASGETAHAEEPVRFTCPQPLRVPKPLPAEAVVRAARRLVPIEYLRLVAMGERAWPGFRVRGVLELTDPAARSYHRLANRLCGRDAADRSWMVSLAFPRCLLSCYRDVALITKSSDGWRIWYSAFRRP